VALLGYEQDPRDVSFWTGECDDSPMQIDTAAAPGAASLDTAGHAGSVQAIREAIAAGDVYQVNLTVRARLPPVSGDALFATLCRTAVPPFAAWIRLPDGSEMVSASPELFFETSGARIRSQPMKGTAGAGDVGRLARSVKDAAELAMITDLIRNDLTQICEPRSVRVDDERRFITLPYAVQTVSEVSGSLLPGTSLEQILRALHPGGSITGAPKRAACRLIRELETSPRGYYCGTLGLLRGERSTFSLLIRTASRTPEGWTYGVGGGVVWDSDPVRELEEIQVKLGALR
jgi:anthranilate/para-aminobenzoate synthase component I